MSDANTKLIIQEFYDKVLITGNFDCIDQYVSSNLKFHTPYLPHMLKGRDQFQEFILSVFSAISQLKIVVNEIIAEGNHVAVRWTIEGFSTNDFMNIPAGGDNRTICIMTHYHLRNGKIVEAWAIDSSLWPRVFDF